MYILLLRTYIDTTDILFWNNPDTLQLILCDSNKIVQSMISSECLRKRSWGDALETGTLVLKQLKKTRHTHTHLYIYFKVFMK